MIQLSKRLLYSIEAALEVACHERPAPVRSVDVTQREGIPARYLEPVLQELVRENILIGIDATGPVEEITSRALAALRPFVR